MPLKNSQYDSLMREYNRKQLDNLHRQKERISQAYQLAPRLEEIDQKISTIAAEQAKRLIGGDPMALSRLRGQIAALHRERKTILTERHLPPDYLDLQYHCPDCKDTGFIGRQKCHCFRQAAVNLLYDQSNLKEILQKENFETFSFQYYSDEIHPSLGKTVRDYMKDVVVHCKNYVSTFPKQHGNLLFTGNTGVGKTFLSNCIAKAMIEQYYSVVYLTATELFQIFSRGSFSYDGEAAGEIDHYVLESDLLIIDDLGTEHANSFTISKLFYCINERISRQKGTIISTNLRPGEIRDIYSERIASRILSNYDTLTLFGNDIRIIKKFGHPC